jgi:hypothetical protein
VVSAQGKIQSSVNYSATDLLIPFIVNGPTSGRAEVQEIGDNVFDDGHASIYGSVTIPHYLNIIGREAFENQVHLTSIFTNYDELPYFSSNNESFSGVAPQGILKNRGKLSSAEILQFFKDQASLPNG